MVSTLRCARGEADGQPTVCYLTLKQKQQKGETGGAGGQVWSHPNSHNSLFTSPASVNLQIQNPLNEVLAG